MGASPANSLTTPRTAMVRSYSANSRQPAGPTRAVASAWNSVSAAPFSLATAESSARSPWFTAAAGAEAVEQRAVPRHNSGPVGLELQTLKRGVVPHGFAQAIVLRLGGASL